MPLKKTKIGRVCFRGDSRNYHTIFHWGFSPRQSGGAVYRSVEQDIDPATAVCVAARFGAAAYFPGYTGNTAKRQSDARTTYVYAVYVEEGYNTHGLQSVNLNRRTARENVFAQEIAADRIRSEHVIAAIEVTRLWESKKLWSSKTANHRYTIGGQIYLNANYNGLKAYKEQIIEYYTHIRNSSARFLREESGFHMNQDHQRHLRYQQGR